MYSEAVTPSLIGYLDYSAAFGMQSFFDEKGKREMTFEHYHRKGSRMLRCGYTTGTCAVLAAEIAARMLLKGAVPETVVFMTGKGIEVRLQPERYGSYKGTDNRRYAWAEVPKDAGDDSDITDGMYIRVDVAKTDMPGIRVEGGKGVGVVTKPGLDQPVGNAAINSGPRRMIRETLEGLCGKLEYEGGLEAVISVPEGEEAAKKTFNPKLGIVGGISILGTTGIVEPMSEQALVDTIEVELKQTAVESDRIMITPGNYGEVFIKEKRPELHEIPLLKISNFLGEALDMIGASRINTVLMFAHTGKLVKAAAGIMNTHSGYADGRNEIFCAHAAICGADRETCRSLMEAATTDACIEILDEVRIRETVLKSILDSIQQKLDHRAGGRFRIGAIMFSNVYGQLGQTEAVAEILKEWEEK